MNEIDNTLNKLLEGKTTPMEAVVELTKIARNSQEQLDRIETIVDQILDRTPELTPPPTQGERI